ncbi:MAG: response regulator [Methylococcaceae bacterium]|nr:MAG: response regulator [Methylococcaceae bacterium]
MTTKIIPRLLLGFLLLSPLPLALLGWLYSQAFEQALKTTVQANLSNIADKKRDQIDIYLSERMADARLLGLLSTTRDALQTFSGLLQADEGPAAPRNQEQARHYRDYLLARFSSADYYDLLLVDALGNVVFSLRREPDLGTNLQSGPYRDSALAQAHRESMMLLDTQITLTPDYAPSGNQPAIFIASPVRTPNAVTGTVVLQLDLARLNAVTSDDTGLGVSGETVLAQSKDGGALYVSSLRRIPDATFRYFVPESGALAVPMRYALEGKRGQGVAFDYAGVEVAAVWRYLPALGWGMVVKMDGAEAFAPAQRLRATAWSAFSLLLLFAAGTAVLFGRSLVTPVQQLITATRRIAEGDLQHQAPVQGWAELRDLAISFNHMAARIRAGQALLEHRVEERTRALQESTARYDLLVAGISAGVYVFRMQPNGSMGFDYVSPRFCELMGVKEEAVLQDAMLAFLAAHPDDRDELLQRNHEAGLSLQPFRMECRFIVRNQVRWLHIESEPVPLENGGSLWNGVVTDVTERKHSEEVLHLAMQAADAANRAKSEFLANMSHEIRTPMNAILGLTQLVLETGLTPHQKDYLQKVHASSKALLGILNDILDYAKIESGHLEIERLPMRVETVLHEVADLFGARIEEKGLELFLDIHPDVPAEVLGDALRLTQVLNNLVGNAVKFTEQGEVHLKVDVADSVGDELVLRYAVRDTGIGLSKSQADRLFQAFTQADSTITRKYGGTGLGLAISQKLVMLMGGDITVSSEEGQGAVFTFTIRVGRSSPAEAAYDLQRLGHMKVLVVDDQPTSCTILLQWLHAWGLHALAVDSGAAALAELRAAQAEGAPFDAVLLDWRMPGMSGLEVARRLEQTLVTGRMTHPLRVVMVTAHDRETLLADAADLRLDAVLSKPVTPSHLLDALVNSRRPPQPSPTASQPAPSPACFDGCRILLAEDNALNQMVAGEFLRKRGIAVTFANDGAEALAWVERQRFDAVLMDLHMPVMDGLEATRRILARPQAAHLPIIAMTAAVLQQDRERCGAAGMVDFVAKPINPQELTRVLQRWLRPAATTTRTGLEPTAATGEPLRTQGPQALLDELPGFDLQPALSRLENDQALLARLLCGFAEEHAGCLERLTGLLHTGEHDQALQLLHSLKGEAANLGASALAEAARQLESALKQGDTAISCQAFADALNNTLASIRRRISQPPGKSVTTIDRSALAEVLTQLKPYLEEHELVPDELIQRLQQPAQTDLPEEVLTRLLRQIDHFNYTAALATLAHAEIMLGGH